MAEIGSWNGHRFEVSAHLIQSFTGLTIRASSATEEQTGGDQGFVTRKNGAPTQISFTVALNALLGCSVRSEAMRFIDEASAGATGYFYIRGQKVVGCLLMLSEASVQNVELTPSGEWLRCEVQLTMQQSGSGGTSSSGGGSGSGGGGGGSSKKSSLIKDNQAIVDFMKSQREKFNSTKDKIKAKRLSDFSSSKAGQKLSSLAKKNVQTTAKEGALARCTKDVNQTISAGKKESKGKITTPGSAKFMMIKKD